MKLFSTHNAVPNWEEALRNLHPKSFAWALRCSRFDRELAQDVLQNTYLKILDGKARYDGNATLKTWLFSVIRFTALDALRKQGKLPLCESETENLAEAEPEIHLDEALPLRECIERLSERQKQIIELVFYHKLSIEESAQVAEIPLGTARTHYKRAKAQLKKHIQQQPEWKELHS